MFQTRSGTDVLGGVNVHYVASDPSSGLHSSADGCPCFLTIDGFCGRLLKKKKEVVAQ